MDHPGNGGVPDGFTTWDEWRRWSVTEFVRVVHDSIQAEKPWVRVSVAALGKYKWTSWQGYGYVFQDAALWFNEGLIEQLTADELSLAHRIELLSNAGRPPTVIAITNECWGKYIQPGIAAGRLFSAGPGSYLLEDNDIWSNHEEIVEHARKVDWLDGFQFFSYAQWRDNAYWLEAAEKFFANKARVRGSGTVNNVPPPAPTITAVKQDTFIYTISVTPPTERAGQSTWYAIYRVAGDAVDVDRDHILKIHFGTDNFAFTDRLENGGRKFQYYATTIDRYQNQSSAFECFYHG